MNYSKGDWNAIKDKSTNSFLIEASNRKGQSPHKAVAFVYDKADAQLVTLAPHMYEALKAIVAKRTECHEAEAAFVPSEIEAAYKILAEVDEK